MRYCAAKADDCRLPSPAEFAVAAGALSLTPAGRGSTATLATWPRLRPSPGQDTRHVTAGDIRD